MFVLCKTLCLLSSVVMLYVTLVSFSVRLCNSKRVTCGRVGNRVTVRLRVANVLLLSVLRCLSKLRVRVQVVVGGTLS